MTIDTGLPLMAREEAAPASRNAALWLVIAAVFAAAVWLRQVMAPNVDVSWWLLVSERVLDGQRLYVDVLETNPPMPLLVYLFDVVLARALDLRPEVVVDGLVFVLIAASLLTTWWILRASSLRNRAGWGGLLVWAALLMCILPMYDFGQREHLAVLTMLPALAVYVLRGSRERVATAAIVVAGQCAGVTMGFKPYFATAVGCSIVAAALMARDWRVLIAPENWIAGGVVMIYVVCIRVFYPEYFTVIYPLVRDVYLLLRAPLFSLFMSAATALFVGAAMIVLALQQGRHRTDVASFVVLAAAFGFAIAFFVQHKGWGYHAYPMVAIGLMAVGCAIAAIDLERPGAWRRRAAATGVVAAMFVRACMLFNEGFSFPEIEDQVARLGAHPKVLTLGAVAVGGTPMVQSLRGTWISRQQAFWVRGIINLALEVGTIDAAEAARLDVVYAAREREGLIEDFRKQPPDVILIDNRKGGWGAWAYSDPELSTLLKPYALVRTIQRIDILRRVM